MKHPQSCPFGTEGRKATHDFLSLYSNSTVHQQGPRLLSQGNSLTTHDFLQPLERAGKNAAKKESSPDMPIADKPTSQASASALEHILPGEIGTFSISHVCHLNQKTPKPEGSIFPLAQGSSTSKNDSKSNCGSYAGSKFTLWEESLVKKGKTRKENAATGGERSSAELAASDLGKRTSDRPSQLSSSNNNHQKSLNLVSSSRVTEQKSQSIIEMIKSAKGSIHEEETDDGEGFTPKKESPVAVTPFKGELRLKIEGKSDDQKPNTPRSKHSATEQRRRSKINDRFQRLREIIPHSDQKRDKASFLLEVIEYIQFLQEKVQKYEGPYQGWTHEAVKLMPWRDNRSPTLRYTDQPCGATSGSSPAVVFASNLDEKIVGVPPLITASAQNPAESSISSGHTVRAVEHQSGLKNKTVPFPLSLQSHILSPIAGGTIAQLSPRLLSDAADNTASQSEAQLGQIGSSILECSDTSDKFKKQEMAIEGGSISISSVYSHGLSSALTKALQSSGVDLSQTRISVQIQLGKRANSRLDASVPTIKDTGSPSINQGMIDSRDASCDNIDQALKKFKTSKN